MKQPTKEQIQAAYDEGGKNVKRVLETLWPEGSWVSDKFFNELVRFLGNDLRYDLFKKIKGDYSGYGSSQSRGSRHKGF